RAARYSAVSPGKSSFMSGPPFHMSKTNEPGRSRHLSIRVRVRGSTSPVADDDRSEAHLAPANSVARCRVHRAAPPLRGAPPPARSGEKSPGGSGPLQRAEADAERAPQDKRFNDERLITAKPSEIRAVRPMRRPATTSVSASPL